MTRLRIAATSGTRITLHLLHAPRRSRLRCGIGSVRFGVGQSIAVLFEAFLN